MFGIVVICAIVGLTTVLIHHRGLLGIADLASRHAHVRPAVVIPGVVVGIFGLHLIEIGLFAGAIAFASYVLHLGRIVGDVDGTDLELLYFSAETFTTLGFGDIIPSGPDAPAGQLRAAERADPAGLVGLVHPPGGREVLAAARRRAGPHSVGLVARPNIAPRRPAARPSRATAGCAGAAVGLGSGSRRRVAAGG